MAERRPLPPGVRERDGVFQARWYDDQGRRQAASFPTVRAAADHLAKMRALLLAGQYVDPTSQRVTFKDWAALWRSARVVARSTQAAEDSLLERWVLPHFGRMQLRSITTTVVQGWVAELSRRELAPATVAKAFGIVRSAMQSAVDDGLLTRNPCARVTLPRDEMDERVFLTPGQFGRLLAVTPEPWRALVLTAYTSGLRWSELAGLRARRLDLTAGQLEVVEVVEEVKGHCTFGPPKTRASRRIVTLPAVTVDELARHLAARPAAGDDGLVFTSALGRTMSRNTFRSRVWVGSPAGPGQAPGGRPGRPGIVRLAGLDPAPRFHDLRHSHVAALIAGGASPKAIQRRLGHGSIRVTLDRYGHLLPEVETRLLADLNAQLAHLEQPHPDLAAVDAHLDAMYGDDDA